jgi:hypothetical protein
MVTWSYCYPCALLYVLPLPIKIHTKGRFNTNCKQTVPKCLHLPYTCLVSSTWYKINTLKGTLYKLTKWPNQHHLSRWETCLSVTSLWDIRTSSHISGCSHLCFCMFQPFCQTSWNQLLIYKQHLSKKNTNYNLFHHYSFPHHLIIPKLWKGWGIFFSCSVTYTCLLYNSYYIVSKLLDLNVSDDTALVTNVIQCIK